MVAVDGGELLGNAIEEYIEDTYVGCIPDHVVVVLSCDIHNNVITIYDPNSSKTEDTYSITQFKNAWNDSKNYLVTINTKDMNTYNPKPIDLSGVWNSFKVSSQYFLTHCNICPLYFLWLPILPSLTINNAGVCDILTSR